MYSQLTDKELLHSSTILIDPHWAASHGVPPQSTPGFHWLPAAYIGRAANSEGLYLTMKRMPWWNMGVSVAWKNVETVSGRVDQVLCERIWNLRRVILKHRHPGGTNLRYSRLNQMKQKENICKLHETGYILCTGHSRAGPLMRKGARCWGVEIREGWMTTRNN